MATKDTDPVVPDTQPRTSQGEAASGLGDASIYSRCPTCNDDPEAAPFCSNGYHAEFADSLPNPSTVKGTGKLEAPYTTPIPAPTTNGANGFRTCLGCEKPFEATRRLKLYCSDVCYRGPKPIGFRFWEKVDKGGPDGCWLWSGARNGTGYGRSQRHLLAHRVSWVLAYGSIPDGLFVCHRCDVRLCVRPDHLFLGTNDDNMADMAAKGRARFSGITHCKNGHRFDRVRQRRGRPTQACSICERERAARFRAQRRAS